jgi:phenylacetate-CoA ligase
VIDSGQRAGSRGNERSFAMKLLDRTFSESFYDWWEVEGKEARFHSIHDNLHQYLDFARERVPFYRERLSSVRRGTEFPLKNVPVLTSDDLREHLPPRSDALMATTQEAVTVFQSGGTTGSPKTALFSDEEVELLTLPNARGFFALGLSKEDRVANLFAVGGLYMTFIHVNRMLQQYGCLNFPFSNQTPAAFVHSIVKLFRINVMTGITSVLLDCLRKMIDLGLDGIKLEKIYYGGEHLFDSDRQELREKFGVQQVAAPGYGTIDTWYIGYQCRDCPPGVFHAHDDQCYIEIVDEERGDHCPPGDSGMIYATPVVRKLTPIIRYKVGDRALWLPDHCPCGRTTPLFKLLGRGDDVLRIGYDSVDYGYIQGAASKVIRLCGSLQMEKRREEGKDRLIIRVETEAPTDDFPAMARALEEHILKERPTLQAAIAKGTVQQLQIELAKPGALERSSRTGKMKRVIDAL